MLAGFFENGALKSLSSSISGLPTQTYGLDGMGRTNAVTASAGQTHLVNGATTSYGLYQSTVTYGSGATTLNRCMSLRKSPSPITCSLDSDGAAITIWASTRFRAFFLMPHAMRRSRRFSCCFGSGSRLHFSARFIEISPVLAASDCAEKRYQCAARGQPRHFSIHCAEVIIRAEFPGGLNACFTRTRHCLTPGSAG